MGGDRSTILCVFEGWMVLCTEYSVLRGDPCFGSSFVQASQKLSDPYNTGHYYRHEWRCPIADHKQRMAECSTYLRLDGYPWLHKTTFLFEP